jgi:hypothetical protein
LKRTAEEEALTYNLLQRITYLLVIFVAFPLMVWTGLAMSPAITSVYPQPLLFSVASNPRARRCEDGNGEPNLLSAIYRATTYAKSRKGFAFPRALYDAFGFRGKDRGALMVQTPSGETLFCGISTSFLDLK